MALQDEYPVEQLSAASPGSLFAAENGKVETAIKVLREEAACADSEWISENLEGAAEYLENEVL